MKWIAPHGATTPTERYVNAQPTIAGSNPDCAFFNTVLDELLAVIVAADMTPTDENLHQIADAIEYLVERAATSGVTKGSYWFGKTTANFTVPNPTLPEQNYIDFTTLNTYSAKSDLSGWTQTGAFIPPVDIDFTILITSKFWDIPEQDDQQGGWAQYNHTDDEWSWWPKIINLDNVVHLTGNETIGGDKKFTGVTSANVGINLYNPNVTKGTAPASMQYWALRANDSSGSGTWQNTRLGILEWSLSSGNTTKVQLSAYANTAEGSTHASISVGYDATNGIAYTSAPAPTETTTTSGQQIATTGWVNTVGNNVMHLTSNETIAGTKTFTDTIKTSFSTQYPNGLTHTSTLIPNNYSSPASNVTVATNGLIANDGSFVAYEQMGKTAGGVTSASLYVRNRANSSGSNRSGAISVSIDSSGNVFTYAPTPPGSANGTTIATTEWIRSHMSPDTSNVTNINSQDGASSGTYTVTGRGGWLVVHGDTGTGTITVNNVIVAEGDFFVSKWSGNTNCQIIVKTGDVVKWNYTAGQSPNIKFMPFA